MLSLKPAKAARKVVPRPRPVAPKKNLLPPKTGGKLFLPGFHRTRQETAAASIILDSLKSDKLKGTSLYGKGFYMTRTFKNQNTSRMISSYGTHLVRVKVDISRFVCFDRSVAKRVWGENHTLADQLKAFGPWTPGERALIREYSKQLAAFWTNKNSAGAVYKREYSNRYEKIKHSADIARLAFRHLHIHEKVPGIAYTGGSDGACVLAYHLDRVTPLSMTTAPKEKVHLRKLDWLQATDRRIRRKHAPDVALKDDIQTYLQKLSVPGLSVQSRNALIANSYAALPVDSFDQLAFVLAAVRVARPKSMHDVRDDILSQAAPRILDLLRLSMPHFCYCRYDGRKVGEASMRLYAKLGGVQDHETESDINALRLRYINPIRKSTLLWDYLRYQFFNQIAAYHREVFLPEARQNIQAVIAQKDAWMTDERMHRHLGGVLFPMFGGHISRYGQMISQSEAKARNYGHRYAQIEKTDGLTILKEILEGKRDEDSCKMTKPQKVPLFFSLIGPDEYLHFMRSQILKVYDALRKDTVIKSQPVAIKILNKWYRTYGLEYRKQVRAFPDYDGIGGTF